MYKIILKVLANIMKLALVISKIQNAFDPIILANECLDNIIHSRILEVLCKLNLKRRLTTTLELFAGHVEIWFSDKMV